MKDTPKLTDIEVARFKEAAEVVIGAMQTAAVLYKVDLEQLAGLVVQRTIFEMRMVTPGDEWRKMVLDACAGAIDQADETLKGNRQTHGMPHAAQ